MINLTLNLFFLTIFYLVIFPISLFFKLLGIKLLVKNIENDKQSYWQKRQK